MGHKKQGQLGTWFDFFLLWSAPFDPGFAFDLVRSVHYPFEARSTIRSTVLCLRMYVDVRMFTEYTHITLRNELVTRMRTLQETDAELTRPCA